MHKEKLSALMDGENLDNDLVDALSKDRVLQNSWQSYHLIRDILHGDVGSVLDLDIANRIATTLEKEPVNQSPAMVSANLHQPRHRTLFRPKVRLWVGQLAQVAVAACVSLAVIIGFQHYNQPSGVDSESESLVFNTLPIMGMASPASFGVPPEDIFFDNSQQRMQEQRGRVNAILQDFELQRRLYSEQLFGQPTSPQVVVQAPEIQSPGTNSQ